MKTIKIANKEYIFAELAPNQSWNPEFPGFLTWEIPDIGTYSEPYIIPIFDLDSWRKDTKIITTTNSITEEIAKTVIEFEDFNEFHPSITPHYYDYLNTNKWGYNDNGIVTYGYGTALESFYSLMDSLELDRNNNYLLIEKLKQ